MVAMVTMAAATGIMVTMVTRATTLLMTTIRGRTGRASSSPLFDSALHLPVQTQYMCVALACTCMYGRRQAGRWQWSVGSKVGR